MVTVDFRTRFEGDQIALDPAAFVESYVPPLLASHAEAAARAATRLGLAPLTLMVDGEPLTFAVGDGRLTVERVAGDAVVVALRQEAFSDLVQDVVSTCSSSGNRCCGVSSTGGRCTNPAA
jgi:hypothetical protein